MSVHGTNDLLLWLVGGAIKEIHMKLTIPAILATALIVAPTAALAQNTMNYSGTSSNPATANSKDETTSMPKQAKKHMASTKKHHSKRMKSSAQPGPGNSSNPAAAATKEDVIPKR